MDRQAASWPNTALLIIDMISDFGFPDGAVLARQASSIVEPIRTLSGSFRVSQRPVIYVNDNFGQWHLSFPELVAWAQRDGSLGQAIAHRLAPHHDDYHILKPRHSGFYETALPTLLQQLKVDRLVLTGMAGDACVLATAMDAHIRHLQVWVPTDGSASLTGERHTRALAFLRDSMGCDIHSVADGIARAAGADCHLDH